MRLACSRVGAAAKNRPMPWGEPFKARVTSFRLARSLLPDRRPEGTTLNRALELAYASCSGCGLRGVQRTVKGLVRGAIKGFYFSERIGYRSSPINRGSAVC